MARSKRSLTKARVKSLLKKPEEYKGIQVNICPNQACANFGLSYQLDLSKPRISYIHAGKGKDDPSSRRLKCECSTRQHLVFNNKSIYKTKYYTSEKYLRDKKTSCKNAECDNHMKSIYEYPNLYSKNGKDKNKKQKYKCKSGHTKNSIFVIQTGTKIYGKHKRFKTKDAITEHNRQVLMAIVSSLPLRSIAENNLISPQTVYDKLNKFAEIAQLFNYEMDEKLKKKKVYHSTIETDAMSITTNWTTTRGTGVQLQRLISAHGYSAFILAMTHDFDDYLTINEGIQMMKDAKEEEDFYLLATKGARVKTKQSLTSDERKYPHWKINELSSLALSQLVKTKKTKSVKRKDKRGIKLRQSYQYMSHLLKLKELIINHNTITLMSDWTPGLVTYTNCIFHERIKNDTLHAYSFGHQFHDTQTINNQKQYATGLKARNLFEQNCKKDPWYVKLLKALSDYDAFITEPKLLRDLVSSKPKYIRLKEDEMVEENTLKNWKKQFHKNLEHTQVLTQYDSVMKLGLSAVFNNQIPETGQKAIYVPNPRVAKGNPHVKPLCHGVFTKDRDRIAKDISGATTHGVDNFIQWSRKSNLLKRKVITGMKDINKELGDEEAKITHDPNKAYEPSTIISIGHIQRFYWNFMKSTQRPYEDEPNTPAMRIGLTTKPITIKEFLTKKFFSEDPF